jgi:ActR/RegA family two-component response regulator
MPDRRGYPADRTVSAGVIIGVAQGPTILFVEDDQPVRPVITEALSARGFRVLAAESAYKAVSRLAARVNRRAGPLY